MPMPGGAVLDGRVHVEPLQRGLLAGDDDVDVVAAAQAVVGHREQRVGVRRQIDADDLGLLVDHVIDEARVLVAEAVVVLPPDVRGEQVVQRGDRPPPRDVPRDLQPLGVLVEHRVDDVDERLVAGEEAVPAGQQVAFEPALAHVLAQHLHHAAVRARRGRRSGGSRRSSSGSSPRTRRPAVRGGLVRAEDAEVPRRRFSFITSRRNCPWTRVASAVDGAGLRHRDGVVAEVRHAADRAAGRPPLACGLAPMRRSPCGRECGEFRNRACPSASNSSSGR